MGFFLVSDCLGLAALLFPSQRLSLVIFNNEETEKKNADTVGRKNAEFLPPVPSSPRLFPASSSGWRCESRLNARVDKDVYVSYLQVTGHKCRPLVH